MNTLYHRLISTFIISLIIATFTWDIPRIAKQKDLSNQSLSRSIGSQKMKTTIMLFGIFFSNHLMNFLKYYKILVFFLFYKKSFFVC